MLFRSLKKNKFDGMIFKRKSISDFPLKKCVVKLSLEKEISQSEFAEFSPTSRTARDNNENKLPSFVISHSMKHASFYSKSTKENLEEKLQQERRTSDSNNFEEKKKLEFHPLSFTPDQQLNNSIEEKCNNESSKYLKEVEECNIDYIFHVMKTDKIYNQYKNVIKKTSLLKNSDLILSQVQGLNRKGYEFSKNIEINKGNIILTFRQENTIVRFR